MLRIATAKTLEAPDATLNQQVCAPTRELRPMCSASLHARVPTAAASGSGHALLAAGPRFAVGCFWEGLGLKTCTTTPRNTRRLWRRSTTRWLPARTPRCAGRAQQMAPVAASRRNLSHELLHTTQRLIFANPRHAGCGRAAEGAPAHGQPAQAVPGGQAAGAGGTGRNERSLMPAPVASFISRQAGISSERHCCRSTGTYGRAVCSVVVICQD